MKVLNRSDKIVVEVGMVEDNAEIRFHKRKIRLRNSSSNYYTFNRPHENE